MWKITRFYCFTRKSTQVAKSGYKNKEYHNFRRNISLKVNLVERLEFKLFIIHHSTINA